jgi:hypothetical protein
MSPASQAAYDFYVKVALGHPATPAVVSSSEFAVFCQRARQCGISPMECALVIRPVARSTELSDAKKRAMILTAANVIQSR